MTAETVCGTAFVKGVKSNIIKLQFKSEEGASAYVEWQFDILADGDWYLNQDMSKLDLSVPEETGKQTIKTFKFKDSELEAANQFSFSCAEFVVRNDNSSKDPSQLYQMEFRIKRFQVQPFILPKQLNMIFADSFDCSTWFTIPLWIGFLVTLLFTAILAFGVYGLMAIKTPDRFENPKGKTITITATD